MRYITRITLGVFGFSLWLSVSGDLYAQAGSSQVDSAALENVSSEDLLKLKEDLESQKNQLELERADLLEKGLQQSKEFLEKGG